MLIQDELPFKFVDGEGFNNFMTVACPRFKMLSRWTATRDSFELYIEERQKLKNFLRAHSQRVSLTTDSWTSI